MHFTVILAILVLLCVFLVFLNLENIYQHSASDSEMPYLLNFPAPILANMTAFFFPLLLHLENIKTLAEETTKLYLHDRNLEKKRVGRAMLPQKYPVYPPKIHSFINTLLWIGQWYANNSSRVSWVDLLQLQRILRCRTIPLIS